VILDLELDEAINPAADKVDCIHGFLLELLKLPVLGLKLLELFEALIELVVVGVQDGGLEGERATSNSENADWQDSLHDEHLG
jgi:hypothetical protein